MKKTVPPHCPDSVSRRTPGSLLPACWDSPSRRQGIGASEDGQIAVSGSQRDEVELSVAYRGQLAAEEA